MKLALAIGVLMLVSGCGAISAESVYEGIRSQQKINTDPAMPNPLVLPPYDQYRNRENPPPNILAKGTYRLLPCLKGHILTSNFSSLLTS